MSCTTYDEEESLDDYNLRMRLKRSKSVISFGTTAIVCNSIAVVFCTRNCIMGFISGGIWFPIVQGFLAILNFSVAILNIKRVKSERINLTKYLLQN